MLIMHALHVAQYWDQSACHTDRRALRLVMVVSEHTTRVLRSDHASRDEPSRLLPFAEGGWNGHFLHLSGLAHQQLVPTPSPLASHTQSTTPSHYISRCYFSASNFMFTGKSKRCLSASTPPGRLLRLPMPGTITSPAMYSRSMQTRYLHLLSYMR